MSIDQSVINDLSKNCRLCMKIGKNVRSIFNDNHKKWATIDISKLIYDCTNIEVRNDKNIFFFYSPHLGIFKLNFVDICLQVTVNDCTTGICLLCYKQITSITNFRERCARANELLKKRCAEGEISQKECIPFVDLGEGYNAKQSESLWTKESNYGEISGELLNLYFDRKNV